MEGERRGNKQRGMGMKVIRYGRRRRWNRIKEEMNNLWESVCQAKSTRGGGVGAEEQE